ncbi:hypothetical protein D7B24_005245 [Verticillium nonalfalfae]|uniref:Uncharacterized protein n=1 Tax=Verticillium nonalfalfae TaxID=1051616 RepID=A0A3M9YG42_9PEZI|nr:uncharacterized protein D7B24_005245 [Verticillium nonalfalfae]RNJ58100.1 hypothetical protein D7B24_005245 [Verticillium nonalfalfae]
MSVFVTSRLAGRHQHAPTPTIAANLITEDDPHRLSRDLFYAPFVPFRFVLTAHGYQ